MSIFVGLLSYWFFGVASRNFLEFAYSDAVASSFAASALATAISGLFGGFVTGAVAKESPVVYAGLLAGLLFFITIICEVFVRAIFGSVLGGLKPMSYDVGLTLCGMAGMLAGGWLCACLQKRSKV